MKYLWVALTLWAMPAAAQDFIVSDGALDDDAFYRLVACAAPPGSDCRRNYLTWPEDKRAALRVGLTSTTLALQPYQQRLYQSAVDATVREVNRQGAGVRMRVTDPPHDIELHIVATEPGGIMQNTGVEMLDGQDLPLGRVAVRSRGGEIKQAVIAISYKANRRAIASVVLEEMVQALGLMTDIRSPAYRRSVFSEDSNSGTRLLGQDAMVIRRHYPPTEP